MFISIITFRMTVLFNIALDMKTVYLYISKSQREFDHLKY